MNLPVLNRKLVLEEAQRVPDGAGGFTLNWAALGTVWAAVESGIGKERAGEFVTLSSVAYRITVRAAKHGVPSRPKPDQRFRDTERIFRILAVTEANAGGHYLTCFAQEEVLA